MQHSFLCGFPSLDFSQTAYNGDNPFSSTGMIAPEYTKFSSYSDLSSFPYVWV